MSNNNIIEKMFYDKLAEGGVVAWCKKRDRYIKAKKKFQICEGKLLLLVKPKMSESEYKIFKKTLEIFKGTIYDMEVEEKIFYYKEGQKDGMRLKEEVIK